MPIGYFIIVLLIFLQTYDILCRKTIIRYVLSYPSSLPTKLPLLPPSSPWRGCSRTPFGRRSRRSIVVGTPIILVGVPVCLFFEVPYLPIRLLNYIKQGLLVFDLILPCSYIISTYRLQLHRYHQI